MHAFHSGWILNYDLVDLDFAEVKNVPTTMRKDLYAAHQLAAEKHDLDYFKDILKNFMEAREADRAAKEAAKAEKKAKKAAAKKKDTYSKAVVESEDVQMADALAEPESEEAGAVNTEKPTKKRKSPIDVSGAWKEFFTYTDILQTPQRAESAKKPRANIKLTTTPKPTNGTSTPKAAKDPSSAKSMKTKTKKATPKVQETVEAVAHKVQDLTAEEKRVKKEVR